MELLLVCHSEATNRTGVVYDPDGKLSTVGMKQSILTGLWIRHNIPLTGYIGFSSPFLRTLQTASMISETTDMQFIADERVRDFSLDTISDAKTIKEVSISNRSLEFQNIYWDAKRWTENTQYYPAEGIDELVDRLNSFYKEVDKALVVTHPFIIILLMELATGKTSSELKKRCKTLTSSIAAGKNTMVDNWEKHMFTNNVKNASTTLIRDGKPLWFSRTVYNDFH